MNKNADVAALGNAGLTKGEAKAYLALLELGEGGAASVAREADLQKSAGYFCLERLVKKGLASSVVHGNARVFHPAPMSSAIGLLGERQRELEIARKDLAAMSKRVGTKAESAGARVFVGWRGIKAAFQELLNPPRRGEFVVFSVSTPEKTLPRFRRFIKGVHRKRIADRIACRLLVNNELQKTIGKDRAGERYTQVRYLPREFATPTVVNVYDRRTLMVVWAEEPQGFLLESEAAADSFRNYFELLWKAAKTG